MKEDADKENNSDDEFNVEHIQDQARKGNSLENFLFPVYKTESSFLVLQITKCIVIYHTTPKQSTLHR